MRLHSTGHDLSACSDTTIHNSIGRLLRQLGELNQSNYSNPNHTSTSSQTYPQTGLNILGYNYGSAGNYAGTFVRNELNNGHIFLTTGTTLSSQGHAWVFDGYITKTEIHYEMINKGPGWVPTGETHNHISYYNHMNWGWYGNNNGYFSENVYNTSQATYWDTSINDHYYDLCYNVKYISVYH